MKSSCRPLAVALLLASLGGSLSGQGLSGPAETASGSEATFRLRPDQAEPLPGGLPLPPPPGAPASLVPTGPYAGIEPRLDLRQLPVQAAMTLLVRPNDAVLDAFDRFDADCDGWLSAGELARYVRDPEDLPPDLDGDGRISSREFLLAVLQTAPMGADLYSADHARYLLAGRRAFEAGDYRDALLHYWTAANEDKDCPDGLLGMGRCLERMGRGEEAVQLFRRAVELAPGMVEARVNLALAEERLGWHDAALAGLRLALRQLDSGGRLRDGWRSDPAWHADTVGLMAALEKRLAATGTLPEMAGELHAFLERAGRAVAAARPRLPQMEVCAVGKLLERGSYREALALVATLQALLPRDWELRLIEAALETIVGRFDAARQALVAAERLGCFPQVLLPVAIGNRLDLGDEAAAASDAERLDAVRLEFWELADLAWQLAYRGQFRQALAPLTSLMAHKAGPGPLHRLLMGLCLQATGEPARALEELKQGGHPASDNPVLLDLEARLCLGTGLTERALRAAKAAVRLAPEANEAWLELAAASEVAGDHDTALEALRRARRLWPAGCSLAPLETVVEAWLDGRLAEAAARTLPTAVGPPGKGPSGDGGNSRKMR